MPERFLRFSCLFVSIMSHGSYLPVRGIGQPIGQMVGMSSPASKGYMFPLISKMVRCAWWCALLARVTVIVGALLQSYFTFPLSFPGKLALRKACLHLLIFQKRMDVKLVNICKMLQYLWIKAEWRSKRNSMDRCKSGD